MYILVCLRFPSRLFKPLERTCVVNTHLTEAVPDFAQLNRVVAYNKIRSGHSNDHIYHNMLFIYAQNDEYV